MKPEEYVAQFRMGQENYEFSREEFLKELSKDFLECFKRLPNLPKNVKFGGKPSYADFKALVREFQKKYWAISDAKPGRNLSKGLWGAFYAMTIIPLRAKEYPELHKKIMVRRNNPK